MKSSRETNTKRGANHWMTYNNETFPFSPHNSQQGFGSGSVEG